MNTCRIPHRTLTLITSAAVALALAGCTRQPVDTDVAEIKAPAAALAAPGNPVTRERWTGSTPLSLGGRESNVATQFLIGASGTVLHFGAPAQCQIAFKYTGTSSGREDYDVINTNGGWCDRALAGQLRLDRTDGNAVAIELLDSKGNVLANTSLDRAGP